MLIDWFTVGAQALNFLILVWLLKRFLYKPVLDAIDAREKRIAEKLADASASKAEALDESNEFRKKNEVFDQDRGERMQKMMDEIGVERERLLDEVRKAADALRIKRQEALENEQQHLHKELGRRTRDEVFSIARKVLTDLGGTSLDQRMSDVFVQRLRALQGQAKEKLSAAVKTADTAVLVKSAFELAPAQQEAIQGALTEAIAAENPIRFQTAPDLIGGMELSVGGYKFAWSIHDYLGSMEKSIAELLREGSAAGTGTAAKAEPTSAAPVDPVPEAKPAREM
ncbi:F0F1 ATP synthase subunit delta [Polaromonas sp.]|uniref:F0F1 ATP synthase subunit delta n=1 Tax=Polaromonas sp. TaxID=1869339 RepID=UPI00356A70B7